MVPYGCVALLQRRADSHHLVADFHALLEHVISDILDLESTKDPVDNFNRSSVTPMISHVGYHIFHQKNFKKNEKSIMVSLTTLMTIRRHNRHIITTKRYKYK